MKNDVVLICMFLLYTLGHSQNLVKNPSFEEYYHLPDLKYEYNCRYRDSAFICKYWHRIKNTTPDYYHINAKHHYYKIPCSRVGCHPVLTDTDSAFMGFIPFDLIGNNESFSGELLSPLKAGKQYEISFFYRFASHVSYFYLNKLEVFLSDNINHFKSIRSHAPFFKDIMIPDIKASVVFDSIINDDEWHKATAYYTAKGGEQYISFGIFYQNDKLLKIMHEYLVNNYAIGQNMHKYEGFYRKHRKHLTFIQRNPNYKSYESELWLISFEKQNKTDTYLFSEKHPYYLIDHVSVIEVIE